MNKINSKLYSWASIIDDVTLEQAKVTSNMPFIFPHLALMPDAHLGKGATVGSVIPTYKAIIPAAVGVDIGCGMIAVQTQWKKQQVIEKDILEKLRHSIERVIPLSMGKFNHVIAETATEKLKELDEIAIRTRKDYDEFASNWRLQLGTLGSGNHFIEVSYDENDDVWLFLHSGSRGVGNKIAMKHIKIAQEQMEKWYIDLPDRDLAYLVEGTEEFNDYIEDLYWAQKFALLNRQEMMDRVKREIEYYMKEEIQHRKVINCHHNFTVKEKVFGRDVWLSRKGAIEATEGTWGLIPGSMGTESYVVTGKGDKMSFASSPHGAGRVYSRSAARKQFTKEDLQKAMKGIEYRDTDAFIDEIPGAYKDVNVVIKDAENLVKVEYTLKQLLNVKGD